MPLPTIVEENEEVTTPQQNSPLKNIMQKKEVEPEILRRIIGLEFDKVDGISGDVPSYNLGSPRIPMAKKQLINSPKQSYPEQIVETIASIKSGINI